MKKNKPWAVNVIQSVALLILGWVGGKIVEDFITEKVLSSSTGAFALTTFVLVLLTVLIGEIIARIRVVEQRVGIRVTYIDRDSGGDRRIVFQRAKNIIENAQESILILNSFIAEQSSTSEEGITYYQTLIRKAREGVKYERILQLQEGDSVTSIIEGDHAYIQHFHDMLHAKESNRQLKMALRKAKAKYMTTFVLVDTTKLLWQVNEIADGKGMRMRGIFIFDDPRQEITQYFKDFFDQIAFDNETVPIKHDELPNVSE